AEQSIALFGKPGEKFEMVMTGRHLTVRVDGNSIDSMAFGGPVFHGHQATQTTGLNEKPGHPGNIWWPQALEANKVFEMLDGKQREKALLPQLPAESSVAFRGKDGKFPGVVVSDLCRSKSTAPKGGEACLRALSQGRSAGSERLINQAGRP